MDAKLKVKRSQLQRDLSFSKWVEVQRVGFGYQRPTRYFQENQSVMVKINPFERLLNILSLKI